MVAIDKLDSHTVSDEFLYSEKLIDLHRLSKICSFYHPFSSVTFINYNSNLGSHVAIPEFTVHNIDSSGRNRIKYYIELCKAVSHCSYIMSFFNIIVRISK